MRNLVVVVVVAVGVAVLAGAVSQAGADPSKDSVKGTGANNPSTGIINSFHVNVQSGPNGEDPKGTVTFTSLMPPKRSFTGEATCLRVTGNQATIVADFSKTRREADGFDANGVIVWVEDNGKKIKDQSSDEIRNAVQPVEILPASCPPPMDPARMALTKGDIRVVDN